MPKAEKRKLRKLEAEGGKDAEQDDEDEGEDVERLTVSSLALLYRRHVQQSVRGLLTRYTPLA